MKYQEVYIGLHFIRDEGKLPEIRYNSYEYYIVTKAYHPFPLQNSAGQ